jgi:cytochrome c oxidase assembly protein subunit 15
LFFYPWQTWVYGPWNLFIEHGHRLLGTLVGMITIGFLASAWWCQRRPLVRWLAVAALAGVLLQGVLGGLRVIVDEVQLAQIHGCVGPAFFAFTVALAAVTSRRWQRPLACRGSGLAWIERLAVVTTLLAFGQLVLGSELRHLAPGARPGEFRTTLFFHLAVAAALAGHVVALATRALHSLRGEGWIVRPAVGLLALVLAQVGLGAATWVTKYGWPAWMSGFDFAARYVPTAEGPAQVWLATAHVAAGSLILGTSLLLALRAGRLVSRRAEAANGHALRMEVAR